MRRASVQVPPSGHRCCRTARPIENRDLKALGAHRAFRCTVSNERDAVPGGRERRRKPSLVVGSVHHHELLAVDIEDDQPGKELVERHIHRSQLAVRRQRRRPELDWIRQRASGHRNPGAGHRGSGPGQYDGEDAQRHQQPHRPHAGEPRARGAATRCARECALACHWRRMETRPASGARPPSSSDAGAGAWSRSGRLAAWEDPSGIVGRSLRRSGGKNYFSGAIPAAFGLSNGVPALSPLLARRRRGRPFHPARVPSRPVRAARVCRRDSEALRRGSDALPRDPAGHR